MIGGGALVVGFVANRVGDKVEQMERYIFSRICAEPGCGQPHHGLGWCKQHYDRYKPKRGKRNLHPVQADERTVEIVQLSGDGKSTKEIAKTLNFTNNQVIGRRWRARELWVKSPAGQSFEERMDALDEMFPLPHQCRWGIGDPGTPGFRFCAAPVAAERAYCLEHCQRAYLRSRAPGSVVVDLAAIRPIPRDTLAAVRWRDRS